MANVKISALPTANEVWNLNEIIPVVNSGSTTTSKRTYGSLFSNHSGGTYTITATDQTYAIIASASASPNTHIRIGGINNVAVISSRGANISSGQMNTIIGSEQDNDSSQPHINGGQYNTIIGSKGGVQTNGNHQFISNSVNGNIYGGEYNTLIGTQGFYTGPNCNKASGIGVEAGGWDGPRYAIAAGGYQLTCTNDSGNDHAALAFNGLTFDGTNKGGFLYKVAGIAVQTCTIENDISAMIAASGRTTLYDQTLHTDNLYSYGRIQSATSSGTSISNEQFLTGGGGMVQYTTIGAGNLNLKINGVRNGEVYHWVINNDTGSNVSINSVATDTGFGITDNSANSLTTGRHIFTIVIVDDHIVVEGTH